MGLRSRDSSSEVLARGVPERSSDQLDDAGLHGGQGPDRVHRLRQSFQPVADHEEGVRGAAVLQFGEHRYREFR